MSHRIFINAFRIIAILEGLSFIILLFFAMPMKYIYQEPIYVKTIGMAHGLLFIAFVIMAFYGSKIIVALAGKKAYFLILISSILPFGTFYADHKYLKPSEQ